MYEVTIDNKWKFWNWTIQDTKVRTNWYSIGQEFTCVQNGTEKYFNEIKEEIENGRDC